MSDSKPPALPAPAVRSTAWIWLVGVNIAVFLVEALLKRSAPGTAAQLQAWFHLLPGEVAQGALWQLLTFQFLHVGALHLLMNCLGLNLFAQPVGEEYGGRAVWRLYLLSGIGGGIAHCILGWVYPTWYGRIAVVGASAGVYGLAGAFCWMCWNDRFKVGLPGLDLGLRLSGQRLFALFFLVGIGSMLDLKSRVAHDAHLGGLFMGLILAQSMKRRAVAKPAVPGEMR